MGREKSLTYIDAKNKDESSSEDDHLLEVISCHNDCELDHALSNVGSQYIKQIRSGSIYSEQAFH